LGWNVTYANGSQTDITTPTQPYSIPAGTTGTVMLSANWCIREFTVQFVNYDSTVLKTETVTYGGSATAPANPSRNDYTFTGWSPAFNDIVSDLTVTVQFTANSVVQAVAAQMVQVAPQQINHYRAPLQFQVSLHLQNHQLTQ
jgi:hypothetical protein